MSENSQPKPDAFQPLSKEKKKRNWVIFGVLILLVVALYAITIIKMGMKP